MSNTNPFQPPPGPPPGFQPPPQQQPPAQNGWAPPPAQPQPQRVEHPELVGQPPPSAQPVDYGQPPQQPQQWQQPAPAPSFQPPPQQPQQWQQPAPQPTYAQPQAPQGWQQQAPQQPQQAQAMAPAGALFGSVDVEATSKTHQLRSSGDWHKSTQGTNPFRIFPPLAGTGLVEPWVVRMEHRVETPGVEGVITELCPKAMVGQRCPICEHVAQLEGSASPIDQQQAKKLKAKKAVIALAIDRRFQELGIRKLRIPGQVYDFLVATMQDTYAPVNFWDPFNGYDMLLVRIGTGMDTKYTTRFANAPSPITPHQQQLEAWVASAPRLTAELIIPTYEAIQARLSSAATTGRAGPIAAAGGYQGQQFAAPPPQPYQLQPQQGLPPVQQPTVLGGMGQVSNNQNRGY